MNRQDLQFTFPATSNTVIARTVRGTSVVRVEHRAPLLNALQYLVRKSTKFLAVHCADTKPDFNGDITDVRAWHLKRNWIDVGYHYVVTRAGTIQTGRPLWALGSHVEGHNGEAVGICLMGGKMLNGSRPLFSSTSDKYNVNTAQFLFTPEQLTSLGFLLGNLSRKYPKANILGHRDFPDVAKECPGFDVRGWLESGMPFTTTGYEDISQYKVTEDYGLFL